MFIRLTVYPSIACKQINSYTNKQLSHFRFFILSAVYTTNRGNVYGWLIVVQLI